MNFNSYFVLSTLVVAGVVANAYITHEQFYPAVVYLSTDKTCLAVMYNFVFALFLLSGKVLLRLFIGTLRDVEIEQMVDSGRGFLADAILFLVFYAPTINKKEVGTMYLIEYICCVIYMKVFHLMTQIRVSHMFDVGVPRFIVNVKLVTLMCMLLACDLAAVQYFYGVASRSSTFFTWILFEALTMGTTATISMCKYAVHMVDIRLDNGWPGKLVCLFYIDLIHDVSSMTLDLVFMLTFFVQNPSRLPIYMLADILQVSRKLAQRLRSFRRYRRISMNMDLRFPDATDEEIDHDEHCVICRESLYDGSKPKKLPCNHIFHIDCLRSWLVMQQACPTCRAEISADGPLLAAVAAAAPEAGAPAPPAAMAPAATAPAATPAAPAAPAAPAPPSPALSAPVAAANEIPATSPAASPAPQVRAPAPHESPPIAPAATTPSAARLEPRQVGPGSVAFAPMGEILEALRYAEEVAKVLRPQTDFWMQQVRDLERLHGPLPAMPSAATLAAGLGLAPGPVGTAPGTDTRTPPADALADPQLAELRRAQRERWQRSAGGAAGGVNGEQ